MKPTITLHLNTLHPEVRKYLKGLSSRGGHAKAARMTREQRVAMAKAMNKASQAAKRKKKLEQAKEGV